MTYSEWFRVDLHIHSDMSKETKDNDYKGLFSTDLLKSKLLESDVRLFSLTDHNIFNLQAYEEYYSTCADEDPVLLAGVELDIHIEELGEPFHALLIFDSCDVTTLRAISEALEEKYTEIGISNPKDRVLALEAVVAAFWGYQYCMIIHAHNGHKGIVSACSSSDPDVKRANIESAQKMILLTACGMEKVKEEAVQHYTEQFRKFLTQDFEGEEFPYMWFSDNHNISKYPWVGDGSTKTDHSFCYLKGAPNFETLRLALIDPKSRIRQQSKISELDAQLAASNLIKSLSIPEGPILAKNYVEFSPHLNVIIGGRSSGKSLLMSLLGNKIGAGHQDIKKYNVNLGAVKVASTRSSGEGEQQQIDKAVYISQGDIIHYFEGKKLKELADKSGKGDVYREAKDRIFNKKANLTQDIDEFIRSYEDCHSDYKNNQTFVLHDRTISDLLNRDYIYKEVPEAAYKLDANVEHARSQLRVVKESVDLFKRSSFFTFDEREEKIIADFYALLSTKEQEQEESEKNNLIRSNLKEKIDAIVSERNAGLSDSAQQKTYAIERKNNLLESVRSRFSLLRNIEDKCQKIGSIDYACEEKIDVNDDIRLVLEVESKDDLSVLKCFEDSIKNFRKEDGLFLNICKLLSGDLQIKTHRSNDPEDFKKKIYSNFKCIAEKFSDPLDYLEYENGDTSKENSPGYNSEKYLGIILSSGNYKTVFIDQPEDNLGNRYVSQKLVTLIRNLKFKKQLFLVTHNPSIVVYGDAENIIIAQNDPDDGIKYEQVVLEDKEAQKKICDIMDGGKYIFEQRARKYNVRRMKERGKDE